MIVSHSIGGFYMKKPILFATLILLSISLTACTYWTNDDDGFDLLDSDLDESINFEKDLSSYDRIEINIDLTVSSVDVEAINGDTLKYEQKANREELLADFDFSDNGDTAVLTFKNDHGFKIASGTQNSEAFIQIPKGIEVVFISNLDVGDCELKLNDVDMVEIDASTNVGQIKIESNDDLEVLSYIKATSDVGDITLNLEGTLETLEDVNLSTNTGKISARFDGELSKALAIESKTDVGEITLNFGGKYKSQVTCKAESSVGDVRIYVPKNHAVELDANMTEFTTSLEISDIPFTKSKSTYKIDGDESLFKIDMTVSVGDATVKYSN